MRYFLYREQESEGCDYSIACGQVLCGLSATTKEDAIKEVIGLGDGELERIVKEHEANPDHLDDVLHDLPYEAGYLGDGDMSRKNERKMASVILYEVNEETDVLPLLQAKFKEIQDLRDGLRAKATEVAERKAYEKMKTKFEKKEAANV